MSAAPNVAELSEWFERQVLANTRLFYTIAYQILHDAHEAEDAVQGSICKAWSNLGELHDPGALVGYVARITRNTAIDLARKRRERVTDDEGMAALDEGEADAPVAEQRDEREAMGRLIGQLPENQAVVVTLRFYHDMDGPAIARTLGMSQNAVRVRLHRALERLRILARGPVKRKAGVATP